jgi:hypothetical protein
MIEDFQDQQRKRDINMRSLVDYTRGAIFILFGLFFIFFKNFNIQGLEYKTWYLYIGILFVLYGVWRMYRGFKKNYYK